MRLLGAFMLRDLRIQRSYRIALIAQLIGIVLTLSATYFFARLVPGHQTALAPYGSDYFTFVLVGTSFATFLSVSLGGFADTLTVEQSAGTLEALLVTPNDPRLLLVGGALWSFVQASIQVVVTLILGVALFDAHIQLSNLLLVAAIQLLALLAFSSIGLVGAAVLIVVKRGTVVLGFAQSVSALLGGVLYPISVLPGWLQVLSHLIPVTYGLDGVRRSLIPSPDLAAVGVDALALATFVVVLLPLSLLLFGRSVDQVRREGSVSQY